MNTLVKNWLPDIEKKPQAKCFDDKQNRIYHSFDEILRPQEEYYYKFEKHACAEIDYIEPSQYIELSADAHKSSVQHELNSCDKNKVVEYAEMMRSGTLFDLPWIDLVYNSQEGRHRCLAAAALGVKKIPVVIIIPWDYELQHKEFSFNKKYEIIKESRIIDRATKKIVHKIIPYPRTWESAQARLDYFK